MNLPLVFDIATGLIFIFLILSLLASEIQELLTTVLQWRAEHLKKSIEVLLTGDSSQIGEYQNFVDDLYNSPLLKSLNQESKGIAPQFFRNIIRGIGRVYRSVTGARNVFGDNHSAPSYIPSKSFADALLQKLDVETLSQKISELTIKNFGDEKLKLVEEVLKSLRNSLGDDSLLEAEFNDLKQRLDAIRQDYRSNRISPTKSIDLAIEQIKQFIDSTEQYLANNNHCQDIILGRLPYLRQSILLRKLEPTVSEVISLILSNEEDLPKEIVGTVKQIRENIADLPPQLQNNLLALADQAQLKAEGLRDGVRKLEKEVEDWYNQSMERASGVYRRNAKGVAILIGLLIAAITNTDTFLIVDRLSRDTAIRTSVAQSANQILAQSIRPAIAPTPTTLPNPVLPQSNTTAPSSSTGSAQTAQPVPEAPVDPETQQELEEELRAVSNAVSNTLGDLPLPIGWSNENRLRQLPEQGNRLIEIPKMVLGWAITGIAISMGSSFWFDLLGKIVRVRNTGGSSKPSPSD